MDSDGDEEDIILPEEYSTELLIDMIGANRALWDYCNPDYKKLPLKTKLFTEIGSVWKVSRPRPTLYMLFRHRPSYCLLHMHRVCHIVRRLPLY
jgi:hypothetical protein